MPNANYLKGRRLEMEIVKAFRESGFNAARSAGSHSKRDIFIWVERGDVPKRFRIEVMTALKFNRLQGTNTWVRTGKKYVDTLYSYSFTMQEPNFESMFMIQCKRKGKK